MKIFFRSLIVIVAILFVILIFMEIGLRVKSAITGSKREIVSGQYKFTQHSYYNPFLIFGPDINKDVPQQSGGFAHFNSQGFRMDQDLAIEKDKREIRIFALGASTTEDIQNGANKHYCGVANEIFKQQVPNKKITCINAGKSGYTTAHSLARLQYDILAFKPDVITVMHNINDLTVNFYPFDGRYNYGNKYLTEAYAPTVDSGSAFWKGLRSFRSIDYIANTMHKIKVSSSFRDIYTTSDGQKIKGNITFRENPVDLIFEDTFKNNLISIAGITKAHNIKIIFLTQPGNINEDMFYKSFAVTSDNIAYPKPDEFKKLFEQYDKDIEDVAQSTNSGFIDLYELVGHDESYFSDVVHTTPQGVQRVGEIYSTELIKQIF